MPVALDAIELRIVTKKSQYDMPMFPLSIAAFDLTSTETSTTYVWKSMLVDLEGAAGSIHFKIWLWCRERLAHLLPDIPVLQ